MKINLVAPINEVSYGLVGKNLFRELDKIADVTLWGAPCAHNIQPSNSEDIALINKGLAKQAMFDYDAPSVRLWHQFDMACFPGRGWKIGFPIFELDSFTTAEKHQLEWLDHIMVPSGWAADVVGREVLNGGWTSVVPLGVDTSIFYPRDMSPTPVTRFLSVGKWEIRKGHDVLIEAFNEAFEPTDKVSLWMLCHNFFLEPGRNNGVDGNEAWKHRYLSTKMGRCIDIIDRVETPQQVAQIMNEVDCGIFPSRAEGWNLELLEMMACGKEVIATNYSAHTEFANSQNCHLIEIDELEEAYDGKFFFGEEAEHGRWASLGDSQYDQLVEHMRSIHKAKQAGDKLFNHEGVATAEDFTWQNSAEVLVHSLTNSTREV
jgi:glycosyltransferase involved in cell wall biosynthesis